MYSVAAEVSVQLSKPSCTTTASPRTFKDLISLSCLYKLSTKLSRVLKHYKILLSKLWSIYNHNEEYNHSLMLNINPGANETISSLSIKYAFIWETTGTSWTSVIENGHLLKESSRQLLLPSPAPKSLFFSPLYVFFHSMLPLAFLLFSPNLQSVKTLFSNIWFFLVWYLSIPMLNIVLNLWNLANIRIIPSGTNRL